MHACNNAKWHCQDRGGRGIGGIGVVAPPAPLDETLNADYVMQTMDDERTYATPDVFRARMQSESDERISHDQVYKIKFRAHKHTYFLVQVFDEDLGYTRPIVVTKSTPEHKAVLNQVKLWGPNHAVGCHREVT